MSRTVLGEALGAGLGALMGLGWRAPGVGGAGRGREWQFL